jgi:hypothetical protein
MRAPSLVSIAILVSCASCATSSSSSSAPSKLESDSPLVGMWRGPVPMGAPDGSCPFDLEIFADGSAEVNHVDDDSVAASCGFVRVPLAVDGDILRLGEAATCRHSLARDGERDLLHVACEDHGAAPATLDNALVLRRLPVQELRGQDAVAGRWSSAPIFGKATELSLDADGRGSMGTELVRLLAHADGTATLELGDAGDGAGKGKAGCIYRATKERLTLRCAEKGERAPSSFVDGSSTSGAGTVVLVRAP